MIMMMLSDPLFAWIAALLLALTFARAAWHKLTDLDMFRAIAEAYELLPARLVHIAAPLLVACEAGLALALLVPSWRAPAAFGAVVLLLAYAAAITINLLRGRTDIDCGCGGSGEGLSWLLVVRNLALAAAGGALAVGQAGPLDWSLVSLAAVALSVASLWLLMLAVEQLAGNNAHLRQLASQLREGR